MSLKSFTFLILVATLVLKRGCQYLPKNRYLISFVAFVSLDYIKCAYSHWIMSECGKLFVNFFALSVQKLFVVSYFRSNLSKVVDQASAGRLFIIKVQKQNFTHFLFIFQKWKKRFFVLSKPAQSLPGTYLLNYYSDENCKRVRGTIDLEQCAEIIESLDSEQFPYLLAIKTTHRGKDRTYFLATDTEDQMSTWVRNLCTVCGMKPDETGKKLNLAIVLLLKPHFSSEQSA